MKSEELGLENALELSAWRKKGWQGSSLYEDLSTSWKKLVYKNTWQDHKGIVEESVTVSWGWDAWNVPTSTANFGPKSNNRTSTPVERTMENFNVPMSKIGISWIIPPNEIEPEEFTVEEFKLELSKADGLSETWDLMIEKKKNDLIIEK